MDVVETITQSVLNNQFVTGLSVTAAIGYIGYHLRELPGTIWYWVHRACVVTLRVRTPDQAFSWLELWLADQPYSSRAKSVMLKSYEDNNFRSCEDPQNIWALSPGDGFHWFFWRKRLVWLDRKTEKTEGPNGRRGRDEMITLATFGQSQKILRAIVEDAQAAMRKQNIVSVRLWRGWWAQVRGKSPRSLDTIILERGQKERIIADMERFLVSKSWYDKRGIPWRRGYLFSGLPGTGKTSLVMALAARLKRPICALNLGSVQDDDSLFSAIMDAPMDAIILIEDIDCADSAGKRAAPKPVPATTATKAGLPGLTIPDLDEEHKGITKAGLLNALDGVTTPDGRILIMTTNFPDKLDDALIRPGRADVHEKFNYLNGLEQAEMAELYYGNEPFMPLPWAIAPAELQQAFMLYPNEPIKAHEYLASSSTVEQKIVNLPVAGSNPA